MEIGTEIYNHGDMANPSHFGIVTDSKTDRWGTQVKIAPIDSERNGYWVSIATFSKEYKGNGSTRLVTKAAYEAWRKASLEALTAYIKKVGAQ